MTTKLPVPRPKDRARSVVQKIDKLRCHLSTDEVDNHPRAEALGYVTGYECAVSYDPRSGTYTMSDPPHWRLAGERNVVTDSETFIESLADWR